jgi:hypothetical protein
MISGRFIFISKFVLTQKNVSKRYKQYSIACFYLTKKTTCVDEMSEKTTCEIFCQKRPPLSGGMSGQLTRGICRLGRSRLAHAAWDKAGKLPGLCRRPPPSSAMGPLAGSVSGGGCLPALAHAAWATCQLGMSVGQTCCHRKVVFFDKKFHRWSFLTFHRRRWSFS